MEYIIRITAEGIEKTFIDEDGVGYKEKWYRGGAGYLVCDGTIPDIAEWNGEEIHWDLVEYMENDDINEIHQHFYRESNR